MKQFYYHKLHFIHQSINTPIDLLKLNRVTFSCSVMNILYNELETEQTIYISIFLEQKSVYRRCRYKRIRLVQFLKIIK